MVIIEELLGKMVMVMMIITVVMVVVVVALRIVFAASDATHLYLDNKSPSIYLLSYLSKIHA